MAWHMARVFCVYAVVYIAGSSQFASLAKDTNDDSGYWSTVPLKMDGTDCELLAGRHRLHRQGENRLLRSVVVLIAQTRRFPKV
jgi:hypothetical protein